MLRVLFYFYGFDAALLRLSYPHFSSQKNAYLVLYEQRY